MKPLSKDKLQEVAKEVFNLYPKAQKVAVTSDGQAFIIDDGGDAAAKNHAAHNIYGKELEINTFMRESEDDEPETPKRKTAVELIAEIEAAESVDAVTAILGDDKRATVVAAAQKKIETLKTAQL